MNCDVAPSWNNHVDDFLRWVIIRGNITIAFLRNGQCLSIIVAVLLERIVLRRMLLEYIPVIGFILNNGVWFTFRPDVERIISVCYKVCSTMRGNSLNKQLLCQHQKLDMCMSAHLF
jgi:uncharacterized membrane protein